MKRESSKTMLVGNRPCGVATWKLVLIAIAVIGMTAIGGISLQANQTQPKQADVDLGFDLPTEQVPPAAEK